MKTLTQWFDDYAVCHQNEVNKSIHYICVPTIFFSIVGLLMCVPFPFIKQSYLWSVFMHWASVSLVFIMIFYARLSVTMALKMFVFAVICIVTNFYISQYVSLLFFSTVVFIVAWIGQFYGHKIEGKKPSFFKDLQYLLIGPAWVIHSLFGKKV